MVDTSGATAASGQAILGIDFGSHTSCICLFTSGRPEVIANALGNRDTPCAVGFTDSGAGPEILTGESARNQMHKNKENTFVDLRKLVETASALETSESEESSSSTVYVPALDRHMPIEELLSLFFRALHDTVAQYSGKRIRDCVMAIPTHFTQASVDLIVEAAKQGGLRVKTTIPEPVAVALAHGIDDPETFNSSRPTNVVVFDLGWSSADITVLRVVQGLIAVESSLRETQICGQLFTDALVDLCAREFNRKTRLDCRESSRAQTRLRKTCEDVMKILSSSPQSTVEIDSLYEGYDLSYNVTRARFEDAAAHLFRLIPTSLTTVLENAGLEAADVSLVLCGGAVSKIPRVQQILQGRFPDARHGVAQIDPEEVVAVGAVLHANYLLQANALSSVESLSSETRTLSASVGVKPGPVGVDADSIVVLHEGSILPATGSLIAQLASGDEGQSVFRVFAQVPGQTEELVVAEIAFDCSTCTAAPDTNAITVDIIIAASVSGELQVTVQHSSTVLCSHALVVSDP